MQIIGKLVSLEKVVLDGRVHLRPLQWELKALWRFPTSLDVKIPVTPVFREYLEWWSHKPCLLAGVPLHPPPPEVEIYTDASLTG